VTQTGFASLHPALQYHVVNSLGWSSLRPTQEAAITPIVAGKDCLILAPTAGGKTEAEVIPVLSRMLTQDWRGLSVLYVCPIKALLNNLEPRLARYAGFVGRSVGLWHGDISASTKDRIRREPPDLLLTTPESLEGILISKRSDKAALLGQVRTVIVDELHAFAGDDRGWHLRAVAKRIERYTAARPQRLGLSATVGNPQELLQWFSGASEATIVGEAAPPKGGNLVIDAVGSLEGAATVLSRLYRGDKRLVFCDSRSKVETLAGLLRQHEVKTFVSHSSLSASERKAAEAAFAEERDCVIVATSTLELGIDVGDLDHVLQIDATSTVSSLLQRMGRTGRRPGMPRNCTFLTTNDEALLIAVALCRLLNEDYTEPVRAPTDPWHLVAQQAMALVLERRDLTRADVEAELGQIFPELAREDIVVALNEMLVRQILWEDAGLLWFGERGEREFGGRNFLELVSSFTTPALFAVQFGAAELGFVDPISLQSQDEPAILSLGGRNWRVQSVDWPRRVAWVEPAIETGRSQWLGSSRALSRRLTQAIKGTLVDGDIGSAKLSKRATARFEELHSQFDFLVADATSLIGTADGSSMWWTFGGGAANAVLSSALSKVVHGGATKRNDLCLELGRTASIDRTDLQTTIPEARPAADVYEQFARELKFSSCLPSNLLERCLDARLLDREGAVETLSKPIKTQRISDCKTG